MYVSKFVLIPVLVPALILFIPKPLGAQTAQTPATGLSAEEDEANLHGRAWTRLIESDLVAEKFDDLDRMAAQLRSEKTRSPGGEWKLVYFYGALDKPELSDKDTLDHLAHLRHWIAQRPESITARVALATSLHRWAWEARGNGMANTVTAEGWRLFEERIQESLSVLKAAANLHEQCPQWYSEMMVVGLAESWDAAQMKEIFEAGIQYEPGYFRLYKQYANYLLPKWDGKPGDASAFAKRRLTILEAKRAIRFISILPTRYRKKRFGIWGAPDGLAANSAGIPVADRAIRDHGMAEEQDRLFGLEVPRCGLCAAAVRTDWRPLGSAACGMIASASIGPGTGLRATTENRTERPRLSLLRLGDIT